MDNKVITNMILQNQNQSDQQKTDPKLIQSENKSISNNATNKTPNKSISESKYSDTKMFHVIVSIILSVQQKDEMTSKVMNHLLHKHKDFSVPYVNSLKKETLANDIKEAGGGLSNKKAE